VAVCWQRLVKSSVRARQFLEHRVVVAVCTSTTPNADAARFRQSQIGAYAPLFDFWHVARASRRAARRASSSSAGLATDPAMPGSPSSTCQERHPRNCSGRASISATPTARWRVIDVVMSATEPAEHRVSSSASRNPQPSLRPGPTDVGESASVGWRWISSGVKSDHPVLGPPR